jgi:hypothetical protein
MNDMKKILLAFDGHHFSEGALTFARELNEKSPIFLTGAFLPQIDYANLWSYSGGGSAGNVFIPLLEDEDAEIVKKNIERFESYCRTNHISYSVHKEYFNFALPEIKNETKYADLLIISSQSFYEQAGTRAPNEYLQETMQGVACPIVIVPEKFEFPTSNILAYDGSESSIYAIKQFAYLFPELTGHPTTLVYVDEKKNAEIPEGDNIKELISHHFPNVDWIWLQAKPKKYFASWLEEQKGSILISGSFGRSDLSMLFRKSFITEIIAGHQLPVFVAHK